MLRPIRTLSLLGLVVLTSCVRPDGQDPELQRLIDDAVKGFGGRVGVYVCHLPTGRHAQIAADSLFPTASMIKVPILLKTFDSMEKGELSWDQPLVYRDSLFYDDADMVGNLKDGASIMLDKIAMMMITTSDNTASLWLQHLSGTGTAINEWLAENGFEDTRVNSRTPGRRGDWEKYGWGQTTPREMAQLLVMIREGRAVSPAASEEMYRMLTRIYWNDEALSQLPPWIQAASKQGAVSQSRSEVVLVNAPSGDYVFAVITDDQVDETYAHDNEGYRLIRRISGLLWNHFEPDSGWQPAPGGQYVHD